MLRVRPTLNAPIAPRSVYSNHGRRIRIGVLLDHCRRAPSRCLAFSFFLLVFLFQSQSEKSAEDPCYIKRPHVSRVLLDFLSFRTPFLMFSVHSLKMRRFLVVVCLVGATSAFPGENAPGLKRDGHAYTFDIGTGPQLQVNTSDKPAPSVMYTTENGAPYSQPYDAQRIGADGNLSIISSP